ncbi:MAG: hypothetical protein E5V62_01435 [Mesorhizobium sp.]|uniref:alkyl sulfatase dimerization domain-containing protein n=1 Tax=Mesorhizobium sp. TaxID=1871066 RepID=UPI000FD57EBA|nr:hypothetical protein EN751_11705 [Mesorhizobium sp. M4A.F.Ca.ET.029.04.2.1]TIW37474.1 MAG: hypothetical protein E5V62_01435 [Mesorhizobium sp.]
MPKYDDPEFLVRAIYHFYAGWFDGNPAHLKPARATDRSRELASLAGGARKLAERAGLLAAKGDTRLALHLAEFAADAAPNDTSIQLIRDAVLTNCTESESSLMGKAFFTAYHAAEMISPALGPRSSPRPADRSVDGWNQRPASAAQVPCDKL